MKSNYEEKREQRIENYKNQAAKNEAASTDAYQRAKQIQSFIPFGQPILVGHHSEGRHRRDISKIDNAMRKSVELSQKAGYYEERAAAAENNTAISSDNPNALELLREKLKGLQAAQELYKAINAALRKAKVKKPNPLTEAQIVELTEAFRNLGMREDTIKTLLTPNRFNEFGIPSYKLTNNNGNMANVRKRIEQLERLENIGEQETTLGDVRILSSPDTNRTQIFFPGKPDEETRKALKTGAFRWAPSESAWQCNLGRYSHQRATQIVMKHLNLV